MLLASMQSCFQSCSKVVEPHEQARLCRYEHPVKGQGIYAYVTLHEGTEYKDSLRKELIQTVREQIGAFAAPDVIHWAPGAALHSDIDLRDLILTQANAVHHSANFWLHSCSLLWASLTICTLDQALILSHYLVWELCQACPRRAQARSCGGCCGRLQPRRRAPSVTPAPWLIPLLWMPCCPAGPHEVWLFSRPYRLS